MKKILDLWECCIKKIPPKLLLIMLLLSGLQAWAAPGGLVSIKVKDASVREVLELLRKQDYRLVYTSSDVNACDKKVTLDLINVPVNEVLRETFQNTSFSFHVEKNVITIQFVKREDYIDARGMVKDEKGAPLPGVTVIVKGTQSGTSTNVNGEFFLRIKKNTTLIFSFIGMENREVTIRSEEPVSVTLKMNTTQMEEAVIIGYGPPIDRNKLTSSVVSVKAKDIIEPVGNSLDQMLQGKIPGMAVLQQTSTVGAAPKIRIRGSSSIAGNREPVWVLDGVIMENPVKLDAAELNSMDKVNLIGNAISGLNPEDIERIDILKDASATAIYGVKAANGVIVITTKRGKPGPPAVNYSTSMSIVGSPNIKKMHLMNSAERIEVSEEMHRRGLEYMGYTPTGVGYEGALQNLWDNKIGIDEFNSQVKQLKEKNINWFDLLYRNSFSQSHTLSVSGASEKVSYYFSAGYSNQKGAVLHEGGERYSFMSNLDIHVSEKLHAMVSMSSSISTSERPHSSIDILSTAYNTSRAVPAYHEDGSLAFFDKSAGYTGTPNLYYNIFHELNTTGKSDETRSINTNVTLDYKLFDWFSLNGTFSYNTGVNTQEEYADEDSYYVSTKRKTVYGYRFNTAKYAQAYNDWKKHQCEIPFGGILGQDYTRNNAFTARVSASFDKKFGNHNVAAYSGIDIHSSAYTGKKETIYGYMRDRGKTVTWINPAEYDNYRQITSNLTPIFTDSKDNTFSYYASANYIYKGKYIFNANVRGDGSNKLGQDKDARFLPIWSVSGRWNVTDEIFMQPLQKVLSSLSLRASFGLQGNVTDAHNPSMIIGLGSFESKSEEYKATLSSLPNPGLKWEKTSSYNVGIDFTLFRGILSGSFEYYTKKGKDQLVSISLSTTNGATSATINGGDVHNKGWELSLSAVPIQTKHVMWSLNFNTSKNKNEVTNAGNREFTYTSYLSGSIIQNGYSLNSFYSYRFGGLDQNGLPIFLGTQYKDEDGNVLINNKDEAIASALIYSGRREPIISGGLSSNLRLYNFSFNFLFSIQLGNKIRLNDLYGDNFRLPYPQQNMQDEFVNRWRNPGDEKYTNIPVLTDQLPSVYYGGPLDEVCKNRWEMYDNSDLRVVSGNFMRCRSISLSYSMPSKILARTFLKSASLGLGVSNPFVIKSKDLKGRDPEQVTMGSQTIPPQKTWSFTLSVTL